MKITWMAGNGKEVTVQNKTSEELIADHTMTTKIDEIEIKLETETQIYQETINLESGKALKCLGVTIRIPADKVDDVVTMITECTDRRNARSSARSAAEKNYKNSYNTVARTMAE